ncbi:MAG: glycosyltransferase [Candidatus Sumerlaeia bacterium]
MPEENIAKYVIFTPARDEEKFIGNVLDSVVNQSWKPLKYVVISDASSDRTDEIVREYARQYSFVELVRRESDMARDFGSKVFAIKEGLSRFDGMDYDFMGNLDADVSFEPDYFEKLISRMGRNPELGIAGGIICDRIHGKMVPVFIDPEWSVSGGVQMFRRETFETIGGYTPLSRGGIDATAEFMTRMHGWKVRTFTDLLVCHLRPVGALRGGMVRARCKQGGHEYSLGYHPLFQMARCLSRMRQKPYVVGGISRFWGYMRCWIRRENHVLPPEVVAHVRKEQMQRLRQKFFG